jgi:hypothetical protein
MDTIHCTRLSATLSVRSCALRYRHATHTMKSGARGVMVDVRYVSCRGCETGAANSALVPASRLRWKRGARELGAM